MLLYPVYRSRMNGLNCSQSSTKQNGTKRNGTKQGWNDWKKNQQGTKNPAVGSHSRKNKQFQINRNTPSPS